MRTKLGIGFITLSFFIVGCNMNPSKEARIQKLESEIQDSSKKIKQLEKRVEGLEEMNKQLISRIEEVENQ